MSYSELDKVCKKLNVAAESVDELKQMLLNFFISNVKLSQLKLVLEINGIESSLDSLQIKFQVLELANEDYPNFIRSAGLMFSKDSLDRTDILHHLNSVSIYLPKKRAEVALEINAGESSVYAIKK